MSKGQAYALVRVIMILLITMIVLLGVSKPFFEQVVPKMESEMMKISYGCTSNKDCSNGVCANGECVCFIDSQCSTSCDKSTGVCK